MTVQKQRGDMQTRILAYIEQEIKTRGYAPSVREIGEAVGLKSTSTVHGHLIRLEKKGLLHRDAMKPRAMAVSYTHLLSDISVENGSVMNDGNHKVLVGWAVPGLDEDAELPTHFTMTAAADHADLSWMMTFATSEPLKWFCDCLLYPSRCV